jgi:cytochrome b6-f complex iron-sulfur subunit
MTRLEFMKQMGLTALTVPLCLGALSGCGNGNSPTAPTNVDFTLDVSTGTLSQNSSYLVHSGVLVARTAAGSFLAVQAACTHEGTSIQYVGAQNDFYCPNHGAMFSATGVVTRGPASKSLATYKTSLTGTSLRVFS